MANFAAISLSCAAMIIASCSKAPEDLDRANCERLQTAMSEAQVEKIIGQARLRREDPATPSGPKAMALSYHEQFGASGPVTVWFEDRGNGYKVSEMWCDGGA